MVLLLELIQVFLQIQYCNSILVLVFLAFVLGEFPLVVHQKQEHFVLLLAQHSFLPRLGLILLNIVSVVDLAEVYLNGAGSVEAFHHE